MLYLSIFSGNSYKYMRIVDFYTGRMRISEFSGELTISARDLTYLRIKGSYFPKLSLDGFRSLEKVDLCISYPKKTNVHRISDLFRRLHNVKSLALSLEIVDRASFYHGRSYLTSSSPVS
jgi:hypothetical protein